MAAASATVDRRRRWLLAGIASGAGLASVLPGCGGLGSDDEVTLRAVNATLDVASIDVQFDDWQFAGAVAYGGTGSGHARRSLWAVDPSGPFEVRRAGRTSILLREAKTLTGGDAASVVVMGTLSAGLSLRVIGEDAERPGAAAARLRLLHAWPMVGAVDVFITLQDQTLAGRTPDHRLGAYDALSAFADANGGGRLRITPAGRTDLVLFDSPSIGLAARQAATLVLCPTPGPAGVAVAVLPQGLPAYVLADVGAP